MMVNEPLHSLADDLPYGHMLTDTVLLLHDPPTPPGGLVRALYGRKRLPRRFALGGLWQVQPRNIDVLAESEIVQIAERVSGMFASLPLGAVVEVRLDVHATSAVSEWERDRAGLDDAMVRWQQEHVAAGVPHHPEARRMTLHACTVTVGLRVPLVTKLLYGLRDWCTLTQFWDDAQLAAFFHNKIHTALHEELSRYEMHAEALTSHLRMLDLAPVRLDAPRIVERLAHALNPFDKVPRVYHPGLPLRAQLALADRMCAVPDGFEVPASGTAHILSLIRPPAQTYPGMLCASRTPLGTRHALNLPTLTGAWPLSLVVQCVVADQQQLKARFESKQKGAKRQSMGAAGENRADIEGQEASLYTLISEMSTGKRVYPTGVHLVVWGEDTPMRALDQELVAAGIGFGVQWYQETHIATTMFFRTLPLGCDPTYPHEAWIRRHISLPALHVANLLPLWGSFRGTRGLEPQALYVNTRGEDVLWNPFDGFKTPHVRIVGASRSGKSAFVNDLLHQTLPLGATAFILDRYGSYKDLCMLHGGTHVALNVGEQVCLGPFDGPLDALHRATLTLILSEMCAGGKAAYALSQEETVILGQLVQAWVNNGDTLSGWPMTSFVRFIETAPIPGTTRLCERFVRLLSPYHGPGAYAGFIDGRNALPLTSGLWSIDISPLKDSPSLMAVLTAILFDRFERYMSTPAHYEQIKFVILDEVAFLLESPESAPFVERLSRTLARMRCSLVVITQNPSDFHSPIGRVVTNNTGTHVFFRLGRDEAVTLAQQTKLPPHFVEMITGLRQYEDCSEALLYIEEGESGVIRVVPNHRFLVAIGQTYTHRMERERQHTEGREP